MKTKEMLISAINDEFIGDAIIDISIQCLACERLYNDMITCKAFPKGIPIKILTGHWDHTKPFKGDNGILFKKIEG